MSARVHDGEGADAAEAPDAPASETVHGAPVTWSRGEKVVHPAGDAYHEVVEALRSEGFVMCVDLTAVDYLTNPHRVLPEGVEPERFEVVVNLRSLDRHERLRVRVQVPAAESVLASLFDVYPGTEAMEREVYDLFGIRFDGHPDLVRILMPDDWEGHPLRKDYPVGKIPVQFKGGPKPR